MNTRAADLSMRYDSQPTRGRLLHNIVLFGRLLRSLGFGTTPGQILDLVAALELVDLRRRDDVRNAARAVFVNDPRQMELFEEAFNLFWQVRASRVPQIEMGLLLQSPPDQQKEPYRLYGSPPEDAVVRERDEPELERIQTYSDVEVLREKDFARMDAEELAQVKQTMQSLTWELSKRITRRRVASRRGDQLDLRRTIRQNLRLGGELLTLARRRRARKERPLVLLCDVSGSMERYSRILIQFLFAVTNSRARVESFVFSTQLTRVTRQLHRRDLDEGVDEAVRAAADWSGGTRIGEAIRTFNYRWARRVLGQGAVVLIISDGWDRGDPAVVAREMARLQRSCHQLIWLNPLLGSPRYEPLTRGIQAALPHVDRFLPVHNLRSLEQLSEVLADNVFDGQLGFHELSRVSIRGRGR